MKNKIKRGLVYLALGFVVLFGLRLAYGYFFPRAPYAPGYGGADYASTNGATSEGARKNYASEKITVNSKEAVEGAPGSYSVDQKYEKVASLISRTQTFDSDERTARDLTKKFDALIQYERSSGLKGSRELHLTIGVPPENFDSMVVAVRRIGRLTSFRVDKTDKTNEYRELNANRVALEKRRDAFVALKEHGGSIEELTNLEDKILEVDQEIQSTGVKLGDYDAENEFCTVRFSLSEEKGAAEISLGQRVAVAFYWTVKYYLILLGMLLLGSLFILVIAMIAEKVRRMPVTSPTAPEPAEG